MTTTKAYPTDEAIKLVMEQRKLEKRVAAVQWMRRNGVVTVEDLAKQQEALDAGINVKLAAKAKPATSERAKSSSKHALTPAQKAAGTKAINEVRGKGAVDRQIKSSLNPKYAVYQYIGLSDGNVCHINYGEEVKAHLLPEKSTTVRKWRAQLKDDAKAEVK